MSQKTSLLAGMSIDVGWASGGKDMRHLPGLQAVLAATRSSLRRVPLNTHTSCQQNAEPAFVKGSKISVQHE